MPEAADEKTKGCPFCAETIKIGARKCRFCGSKLDENEGPDQVVSQALEARIDNQIKIHREYLEGLYDKMASGVKFFASLLSLLLIVLGWIGYGSVQELAKETARDVAKDQARTAVQEHVSTPEFQNLLIRHGQDEANKALNQKVFPRLTEITKEFDDSVQAKKESLERTQDLIKDEVAKKIAPQLQDETKKALRDSLPVIVAEVRGEKTIKDAIRELNSTDFQQYLDNEKHIASVRNMIQLKGEELVFPLIDEQIKEGALKSPGLVAATYVFLTYGKKRDITPILEFLEIHKAGREARESMERMQYVVRALVGAGHCNELLARERVWQGPEAQHVSLVLALGSATDSQSESCRYSAHLRLSEILDRGIAADDLYQAAQVAITNRNYYSAEKVIDKIVLPHWVKICSGGHVIESVRETACRNLENMARLLVVEAPRRDMNDAGWNAWKELISNKLQ